MIKKTIMFPIWGTQSIGVAKRDIRGDMIIEIVYRNKYGDKVYPDTYFIKKAKALSYPTKVFPTKNGGFTPPLKIIPINELEVLSQDEIDKFNYLETQGL